jgi:hypothetical protein
MDEDFIEDFVFIKTEDVDWQELHAKILEERKQKNLTITDFVVSCGLSPNRPYFKQLSGNICQRLPPSTRRNSAGREFRDAVTKYFAENNSPTVTPKSLENVGLSITTPYCKRATFRELNWSIHIQQTLRSTCTKNVFFPTTIFKKC